MITVKKVRKMLQSIQMDFTRLRGYEYETLHNSKSLTDYERGYIFGRMSAFKDARGGIAKYIDDAEYIDKVWADRDEIKK